MSASLRQRARKLPGEGARRTYTRPRPPASPSCVKAAGNFTAAWVSYRRWPYGQVGRPIENVSATRTYSS